MKDAAKYSLVAASFGVASIGIITLGRKAQAANTPSPSATGALWSGSTTITVKLQDSAENPLPAGASLQEGQNYTGLFDITNGFEQAGQPIAQNLTILIEVDVDGQAFDKNQATVLFKAGETNAFAPGFVIPAGTNGTSGILKVTLIDGDGNTLATGSVSFGLTSGYAVIFSTANIEDFGYTVTPLPAWDMTTYNGAIHGSWSFTSSQRIEGGNIIATLSLSKNDKVLWKGQINSIGGLLEGSSGYYFPQGSNTGGWPYVGWPIGGNSVPQMVGDLSWSMTIVAHGQVNGKDTVVGQATFKGTVTGLGQE